MVLSKSVQLEEDDFTATGQHPNNTIMVTFEGPGAAKTPLLKIQQFLQSLAKEFNIELPIEDIKNHYRGEEACRVYFPLPEYADATVFHGYKLEAQAGISFTAFLPNRSLKKIFLNYVPPTISETGFFKLTSTFIAREDIWEHHQNINGRIDRHLILCDIEHYKNIPHFIDLLDKRTQTTTRIPITIPGRLPLCAECGNSDHYASQCANKKTLPTTKKNLYSSSNNG